MIYQIVKLEEEKERWNSQFTRGACWKIHGTIEGHTGWIIGVDPGVNFGVTVIHDSDVYVHWGALAKCEKSIFYASVARNLVQDIIADLRDPDFMVLEGAAFNKTFGQVGLAEVRTGFYIGMSDFGPVEIPAPMTVRKAVFGNGKTQPADVWPLLNHNAADSLSIALYALR